MKKASRHPEVHDEAIGTGEGQEDVLPASIDALDGLPFESGPEARGRFSKEISFVNFYFLDDGPGKGSSEPPDDGFDLGKLRHRKGIG